MKRDRSEEGPDEEIVAAVLGGDLEAYGRLVARYQNLVYGLAYDHLGNFEEARDAAQETFLQAYLHLRQLREPARFAAWMRQLAANECRMALRRRRPAAALEGLELPDPRRRECEVEQRLAVRQAMERLPEANRQALTLFAFEERSVGEIAAFLEVPATTVKSRIRNARAQLRREWLEMMHESLAGQPLPPDFAARIVAFFDAARANDVEAVAAFVEEHPALVHRRYALRDGNWEAAEEPEPGDTALHFAAFHGHAALAGALLERGAEVDARNHDGAAPVVLAAWEGGAEVLRVILAHGPDLTRDGAAALYTAAEHLARDRCDLLLAAGAQPDLHAAVMLGLRDRVAALLDADPAALEARDRRGRTPLDLAVEFHQPETAALLVDRGAAVGLVQAAGLGMLHRVRALVEADPAAVNPTDGSLTPLMAAARSGAGEVMEYLLAHGADAGLGQVEYIHRILPIHVAAPAAVPVLVAAGADVNLPYRDFTPLQRALSRGDAPLVEALRSAGGLGRLYLACRRGDLEMVWELVAMGADINEPDEQGVTPLAHALRKAEDPAVPDPAARARFAAIGELLTDAGALG